MRKILGVDVGGTKIASVLIEPEDNFKILAKTKIDTEASKGVSHILERIFLSIDSLLADYSLHSSDLAGLGIALPGPVNSKKGLSIECVNLTGWENIEIKRILEERYNTYVYVENDALAAAVGEAYFGIGKKFRNFLYISISTGIGCGIIIDGKLYKGADGAAGELSHVIFSDKSSLLSHASGKALQERFCISGLDIQNKCEAGESDAISAFEHFLHYLGIGIGNAVTLLNPEAVIIGGGLSNMGDFLLVPLEKRVKENAFSVSGENIQIFKAENNIDAGVLGIASLVEEKVLKLLGT